MKSPAIRNVLVVVALILIGAIWQITSLFLDNRPITNYPPKGDHIIALGDSLTVGIGASAPENGFIAILEKRLSVTIENKGVSGNTSLDGLQRLEQDVLNDKPDIVILLLGGNDNLRQVPIQETFTNLRSIITKIQSQGAVVLLLGVRGGLLTDKFDDNFETLANETGALYVPNILEGILGVPSLMFDVIHPNDAGYLKIADKIAPSLLGLVSAILPPSTRE